MDGCLKLKRPDALETPPRVKERRRLIEACMPRIRIEDLLAEVDAWCHFTRMLTPLRGYEAQSQNLYLPILAALVAHGTNLGIAAMGHSAEGITVDLLQHVSKWFLREETLRAANNELVNYLHRLPLTAIYGGGTMSSSDGQRFALRPSSLLGSFYPREFGHYGHAIAIYTHVSDEHSVFSTKVISCAVREAIYVLEGLLENDTALRPREHTTDTHGYTEILFGLCHLLGFSFMPRLADLADQKLYKLDRDVQYGSIDELFSGAVDLDLILEQWDSMVRVVASLRARLTPAHVVMQRLHASAHSDRLAKAFQALGRILKTIHILRYIHDPVMRGRIQLQLNRGEARHDLARVIFFAKLGEFAIGDYEEIMNKASCLSLLCNAVLVWNTVNMERIVNRLRATGESITEQDLVHISPLMRAHVIPNGTYHFRRAAVAIDHV